MAIWHNESEMLHVMKTELYSSVIGDILDQMGYVHQFLPSRIQPLREHMVVAGRAMTVLEADVCAGDGGRNPVLQRNFGLMLEALDDLKKDEIYICSGASPSYALVGELMCTRMQILGAAGCVVNGFHRDTRGILDLDFPCFSYGRYAQDQAPRGKVLDYRVPIEMDGVRILPGDLIFGDLDGVLVIPRKHIAEVIEKSLEKARGEKLVRKAIEGGMSATEAFRTFGIL